MVKISFLLFFLLISPALACGVMEKADPKVGSIVAPTDQLTLTFTQTLVPMDSKVTIADRAGNNVLTEKPIISNGNKTLMLKISRPLQSGMYQVSWSVHWQDCDSKTQGHYKFTVE